MSRLLDDVASSGPGPAEFCSVLQDMRHVCLLGHWVARRILSHTWRGPECEVRHQQDCFLLEAVRRSPLLPLLNWRLSLFMGLYAHHLDFCLPRYRVCVCVCCMYVCVCLSRSNKHRDGFPMWQASALVSQKVMFFPAAFPGAICFLESSILWSVSVLCSFFC